MEIDLSKNTDPKTKFVTKASYNLQIQALDLNNKIISDLNNKITELTNDVKSVNLKLEGLSSENKQLNKQIEELKEKLNLYDMNSREKLLKLSEDVFILKTQSQNRDVREQNSLLRKKITLPYSFNLLTNVNK